jgi:hypothetical protein
VIIVEEFDPESSLENYKRAWINRIQTVASDNGFTLVCRLALYLICKLAKLTFFFVSFFVATSNPQTHGH